MEFRKELEEKFLFFDGGLGTMLIQAGLKSGEIPESYNITKPEIIRGIHESYVEAGADIITTNTFQANETKLKHSGYSVEEIIERGVTIAKESGAKYVALDIGPLGEPMEPLGKTSFDAAYNIFARQVRAGEKAGADLILIETLSDIYEAKAAILAAKENSSLPVICTMTFQKNQKTLLGTDPMTAAHILQSLGVCALGVNCSLGPREITPIVETILKYSQVPVLVQPNAGLPQFDGKNTYYDVTPEEFAQLMKKIAMKGVRMLGGCCGTTPDFIKATSEALVDMTPIETKPAEANVACSGRTTVNLEEENIKIGVIDVDSAELRKQITKAKELQKAEVDILELKLELATIPESLEYFQELITKIQKNAHLPFMISASEIGPLAKAVRIYNGKPAIRYTGDPEDIEQVLAICKKYGATLI